ncbi:hypothetical protein GCM10027040_27390 [Halomonas shantousis]
MYDREMAQAALQRTSPKYQAMVEEVARKRGMAACDVALETALLVAQEATREALFALNNRKGNPPPLRLV